MNLKVYVVNFNGKTQRMVAASSMTKAAALSGMTPHHFKGYGTVTGNKEDIALAMSQPGAVFSKPYSPSNSPWTLINPLPELPKTD